MSYDGWKDDPEYLRREAEFNERLRRRSQLQEIVREKYPEVWELLTTYYKERDWH